VSVRLTFSLLICLSVATCLSACGGGGSSASTASSTSASDRSSTAGTLGATTPAAGETTGETDTRASRGSQGVNDGASAFLTPGGDNSIPEYGAEAPLTQQTEATEALKGYLGARAESDWSAACSYLGSQSRGLMEKLAKSSKGKVPGCAGALAVFAAHTPPAELADPLSGAIAALRVKGEKAFALFYGPHEQKFMIPMTSEEGAWKVNQIAPVPYPPGVPGQ
jgi:hypothetical protein